MSAVLEEPIPTFADWVSRLGDIPLNRILMKPEPGTATEADLLRVNARDHLCELIDGVLVEKAMGNRAALTGLWLSHLLISFVQQNRLGVMLPADGMLRLLPGNVRLPDITFIGWDYLPGRRVPDGEIWDVAPTLAVEVLSPSNTRREMAAKRREYFASGTRLVWEIDPENRTVRVYTSATDSTPLTTADTLDGGDVLPGFAVPVSEIFAGLDEQG